MTHVWVGDSCDAPRLVAELTHELPVGVERPPTFTPTGSQPK